MSKRTPPLSKKCPTGAILIVAKKMLENPKIKAIQAVYDGNFSMC